MKRKSKKILIIAIVLLFVTAFVYGLSNITRTIKLDYTEKQKIDYKVYLTDNSYYGTDYLDEGLQYISSIIDYVDIKYNYKVKFDEKIDYTLNSKVIANIKFVDINNSNNVIYNTEEVLDGSGITKKDNNVIEIEDSLIIDYKKYNKIANEFKSNYGISANCKLVIEFFVEYDGAYHNVNNISSSSNGRVEIPLSKQMITIDKTDDITNRSYFELENNEMQNKIKLLLFTSICCGIVSLIMIVFFVRELILINKNKDKYESHIKKLLRQYDSYITESKVQVKEDKKTVIKCNSFKELMDVRNNIEKAIVYIKVSDTTSKFILIDDNVIYSYNVSAKDFK